MRKWSWVICLLLCLALPLAACGKQPPAPSPDEPGITTPEEPGTEQEKKITFSGTVTDCFGAAVPGADILQNGAQVASTDAEGAFTLADVPKTATVITVTAAGFLPQSVDLGGYFATNSSTVSLDPVRLVRDFASVSTLEDKPWAAYPAFGLQVTRDADRLLLRAASEGGAFTDSALEFYISVGKVSATGRDGNVTRVSVADSGAVTKRNYGGKNIDAFAVTADVVRENGVSVTVGIPFAMLGCAADAVVGLTMELYSYDMDGRAQLLTLDGLDTANALLPQSYIRADKNNEVFASTVNMRPEDVPPTVDREALTRGYRMRFSVPSLSNRPDAADDMYLKAEKEADAFLISMVGFGEFTDREYVKLIFHTVGVEGVGWSVQANDLQMLVAGNRAQKRTGLTSFWTTDGGYSNFSVDGQATENSPIYTAHDGYFTLTIRVLFDEIPAYAADATISLFAMEFEDNGSANGVIYDASSYVNGMLIDGASRGDPAAQNSYFVIQSPQSDAVDPALIEGYNLRFSMGADDIYAKVERGNTAMTLYLRSFRPFGENDFVRMVVHVGTPIGDNAWALHSKDVSFTITQAAAYTQTGKIGFHEGKNNKFHDGIETLHKPIYEESEGYWSLSLTVEYIELGADVDGETGLRAFLGEYVSNVLYLGAMQDGVTLDDPAYQKNWFAI
ncbi:MAG: carboxypeptidase regulatory-like domain-containing protein [Clostridia bacterium]|nr:carboxypeptidase regulatory-like domain-containing protein [Clostridia bacterium]